MGELAMGLVILVLWLLAVAVVVGYPALVTLAAARRLNRWLRARGGSVWGSAGPAMLASALILMGWCAFPEVGYPASVVALVTVLVHDRRMKQLRPSPLPRAIVMSCPAPR